MSQRFKHQNMDITSLFLGPKSENNETFKHFFQVIVEDILNFRNNYHPDEPPIISEQHKLSDAYVQTRARFMQELKMILGKLRAHSVPAWDTSYIAHMNSDLIYPAIAGYLSTIMYNPNNVTGEVSTVTTQWEMDFIDYLTRMVGYPPFTAVEPLEPASGDYSWGHITSGGTVANIEGLWVARNLKYLPVSLRLAIDREPQRFASLAGVEIPYFGGRRKAIGSLTYTELFSLSPAITYELFDRLQQAWQDGVPGPDPSLKQAVKPYSLQFLGVSGIHDMVKEVAGLSLPRPRLVIAQTKHYCWEKSMEVLGLGMQQMVTIPTDHNYRLDMNALRTYLDEAPAASTLAVVPIIGTTEEGVMDPMHELLVLRQEMEDKRASSFYIHADAAYGGYFAAIFSGDAGARRLGAADSLEALKGQMVRKEEGYVTEEDFVIKAAELDGLRDSLEKIADPLAALQHADSITIDPHKLGYIPYPAGSVLFRNYKAKELISFEAPYLKWSGDSQPGTERIFTGQATLEGSRPGAAAAASFLATRIVPLDITGYGKIMSYNMIAAQKFYKTIPEGGDNQSRIIPQYVPDTNVVCYCVGYPGVVEDPRYMNLLANKVFENMTKKMSKRTASYEYFISKTKIHYDKYTPQIRALLDQAGIPREKHGLIGETEDGSLLVLRSVLMNPLALGLPDDYYSGFWQRVQQIADEALEDVLDDIIKTKFDNKRVDVLWIENRQSVEKLKDAIETSGLGRYFSFSFLFDNDTLCDFVQRAGQGAEAASGNARVVITDLCLDKTDEESLDVGRMIPVLRQFARQKKQVICYSSFLSPGGGQHVQIKKRILDALESQEDPGATRRVHFVGKEAPFEQDGRSLGRSPGPGAASLDSDEGKLIRKLILALQRVSDTPQ